MVESNQRIKLTDNFNFEEYFVSSNYPGLAEDAYKEVLDDDLIRRKLSHHATLCAQPIRDHVGSSVSITSGYRSKELNEKIGGSSSSDHMKALAGDLVVDKYLGNTEEMKKVFQWAIDNLCYRQIIWYPQDDDKFIHTSINWPGVSYKHEARVKWNGEYMLAKDFFKGGYV